MTRAKGLFDLFNPPSGIYITFSNYLPPIGTIFLTKNNLGIVSNHSHYPFHQSPIMSKIKLEPTQLLHLHTFFQFHF